MNRFQIFNMYQAEGHTRPYMSLSFVSRAGKSAKARLQVPWRTGGDARCLAQPFRAARLLGCLTCLLPRQPGRFVCPQALHGAA